MEEFEVPDSWLQLTLGEIVEYGKADKAEPSEIPDDAWVLELEDIEKDTSNLLDRLTFAERQSKSTKNLFSAGDVLYGKLRPYLNKVLIAVSDGYCTTEILPLKPNQAIDGHFLFYWLKHHIFLNYVESVSHGLNMPRLGTEAGKQAPLLLPPLNEQKRIVAKIEELRERSQKARSHLSAIPNLCNKFRQSVLAAAFRGDLTADWREQNPDVETAPVLLERIRRDRRDQWEEEELKRMRISGKQSKDDTWKAKYKEPLPPKLEELTNLPEAWGWATLDQIMKKIVDGTHHTPTYIENGVPFLSVKDIRDENIYFDNCKYISPSEHEVLCQRCKPEPGDILVTKSGTIGRCAVIETNRSFSLFVSVALLKPATQEVLPEYISIAFQAWLQTINVQNDVTGSAIKNFHIIDFRKLALPIPPIAEQKEIIQQVRNLLNAGNKSKHQIQLMQDALSELDRSILAKAFRGELVEQDPNDEPASVLLERIRAEREQQTQGKAKKPGKKGQRTIKTDPP